MGDLDALVIGRGLGQYHFLKDVGGRLPFVRGVSLADVDDVELNLVAEALANLFQAPGLVTEGRSSIGAEDEADGLAPVG